MPSKIRRDDWERYFSPRGPRHGGPLSVLFSTVLVLGTVVALGFGMVKGKEYLDKDLASRRATATVIAATRGPEDTATALAAIRTATARRAPSPTPEVPIVVGTVVNGGNLRSEPRVAPETVVGQIATGAEFLFFEERTVDDQTWYRIRITKQGADDGSASLVPVGTEGWASTILLSELSTPVPSLTETPTVTAASPTPVGPLGVLRSVVNMEHGVSVQIPESWSEMSGLDTGQFGWASTTSDQVGMLVGGTASVTDNSTISIGILSESCLTEVALAQSDEADLPTTQKEGSNPDGTMQGTVEMTAKTQAGAVPMRGRTKTYLKANEVICLMLMVPTDQFAAKSAAMQQILDDAIIQ